ncbi:hypothetical protein BGW38_001261 [Lunasporangiospora selenospora]|uniref:RRM domain-containing protein n=1 Tax=Lunasporangiospora selenospora TaxID=979761 RepID=A0A9P6G1A6_9FUNG|nr:hypothetical protein BGW38_001261 [Lunasporangiospora selenospora]
MGEKLGSREDTPTIHEPGCPESPLPSGVSAGPSHCPTEDHCLTPTSPPQDHDSPFTRLQLDEVQHPKERWKDTTSMAHGPILPRTHNQGEPQDKKLEEPCSSSSGPITASEVVNEDGPTDDEQEASGETVRGEPKACLFVASLAATRTDAQLVDSVTAHFKEWGTLLNVKVLKDSMQRPYSFVQFENVEDAQRAMAEAQNTVVDGRHIRIEQARVNRTLFIVRFARTMNEQDLTEVLRQYGPLEDVSIFHDLGINRSRRYAFAKYAYRDDAIKAYVALRSESVWTVEWAPNLTPQSRVEKESVFIGQLNPDQITERDLRERFGEYGTIVHVDLIRRNKPGIEKPMAYAFIEFDDEHSARRAIEHENTATFQGYTIRVQHRESNEFRAQRQSVAQQAARGLSSGRSGSHGAVVPAVSMADFGGSFSPYKSQGYGRGMYYPGWNPYLPSSTTMSPGSFVPRYPQGMVYPQGGSANASSAQEASHSFFQGMNLYNSQGNIQVSERIMVVVRHGH